MVIQMPVTFEPFGLNVDISICWKLVAFCAVRYATTGTCRTGGSFFEINSSDIGLLVLDVNQPSPSESSIVGTQKAMPGY